MKAKLLYCVVTALLLTSGCGQRSAPIINQDKNQAKSFAKYTDNFVGFVDPLELNEDFLKMKQLLQSQASFYDFYIDESRAKFMNLSCYMIKDGLWQHRPIAAYDIEFFPINYAYYSIEEYKNNDSELINYQISFTTFDASMEQRTRVEIPLDIDHLDPLKNAIVRSGIDFRIDFEMGKEYILYYVLSNDNGQLHSLNIRELSQFIEENNKTNMYEAGFVLTVSLNDEGLE